jgi:branched-chain amino acid transport system substrate-binding protein
MKRLSLFLFSLIVLICLSGPGYGQPSLKVGGLIPFSGRWGDLGRECAKGMLDAGKWMNQRGGIYGRKLEIFLIDDTSQPAEIMASFRKLNEAEHILLLYLYSVDTGMALLPHVQFNRIPTLFNTLPSYLSNPSQYPYVFSATPTSLDLAKIAMHFISEKSGIKSRKPKVVFIGSPEYVDQYFLDEAKSYAKTLGLDTGKDLKVPDLAAGKSTSSSLLAMSQYGPDFAYLSLTPKEASAVFQEAKKLGLKTKWICNTKAFDENLAAFDGTMGVQPVSPFGEDVPGMAEIKEAHQRWHPFDAHTLSYVEGWATVQVIAEALGRALPESKLSREKVKGSLEEFRDFIVGGLVPPLTLSAKDHRPSVESRILIVKDGKLSRHTSFISAGR